MDGGWRMSKPVETDARRLRNKIFRAVCLGWFARKLAWGLYHAGQVVNRHVNMYLDRYVDMWVDTTIHNLKTTILSITQYDETQHKTAHSYSLGPVTLKAALLLGMDVRWLPLYPTYYVHDPGKFFCRQKRKEKRPRYVGLHLLNGYP